RQPGGGRVAVDEGLRHPRPELPHKLLGVPPMNSRKDLAAKVAGTRSVPSAGHAISPESQADGTRSVPATFSESVSSPSTLSPHPSPSARYWRTLEELAATPSFQ